MFHHLTIGYLDVSAVHRRKIASTRPLTKEVYDLVQEFADTGTADHFDGQIIEITSNTIRCPWDAPRPNLVSIRFAIEAARRCGCQVVDLEHGKVIEPSELIASIARHESRVRGT